MVASQDKTVVLSLDGDDWRTITDELYDYERTSFSVNLRRSPCTTTPRVGLIVAGGSLVALALLKSRGRSGALDTLIGASHVMELSHPVDSTRVIDFLSPRVQGPARAVFEGGGVLTERAGTEAQAALRELSTEASDAFARLRGLQRSSRRNVSAIARLLEEQRDAIALGLEASGLDSQALIPDVTEEPEAVPFLTSIARAPASEAALLRHDSRNFPDWEITEGTIHDEVTFTDPRDPRRRVTVLYVDKEDLERVTGTDLIYYREDQPGFVLVQYKRMTHDERANPGQGWGYRPDRQLNIEIARMHRFNRAGVPSGVADWRLSPEPFYFKLIQDGSVRPTNGRLVKGMYLPLDLFELVLGSLDVIGPRGGLRIGWHNAGRYLTNTDFLNLIQDGLIGSTGSSTSDLSRVIQQVIAEGRGAVVVRDETPPDVDRRRRN